MHKDEFDYMISFVKEILSPYCFNEKNAELLTQPLLKTIEDTKKRRENHAYERQFSINNDFCHECGAGFLGDANDNLCEDCGILNRFLKILDYCDQSIKDLIIEELDWQSYNQD